MKWGMSGKDVDMVHLWLSQIFEYWGDKYPVPGGGLYSYSTKEAVEHYQRHVSSGFPARWTRRPGR